MRGRDAAVQGCLVQIPSADTRRTLPRHTLPGALRQALCQALCQAHFARRTLPRHIPVKTLSPVRPGSRACATEEGATVQAGRGQDEKGAAVQPQRTQG